MKSEVLKLIIFLICFSITVTSQSQVQAPASNASDTATVNNLLQKSKESLSTNPDSAISIAFKAMDISKKIKYKKGTAYALKNVGLGYYYQGKYVETLDYWTQSLKLFEKLNDETGIANLLNNIGAVYSDQGDDTRALEYSLKSLNLSEKLGDKLRILSALNTVANVYLSKSGLNTVSNAYLSKDDYEAALNYLLRALPLCEETGNKEALGTISENIGDIYFYKGDDVRALDYYNKSIQVLGNTANSPFAYNGIGKVYLREGNTEAALKYHNIAYDIAEKLGGKLHMARSLQGIANVYISIKDYKSALNYYKKAELLVSELKSTPNLKDIYQQTALAYEKAGDYKNAFKYQIRLNNIKDTIYKEITEKKLGALQFDFDLQKKQGEINLLHKDKDLQTAEIKRQKFFKKALIVGLTLVMMIAILIFRNYRIKVKTHRIVDHQKQQIENLLLNILPSEVAKELQVKGHATPKYYESVSVMFTDFKGFTLIADAMAPDELVKQLDTCFIAFDAIIEKYNLEKIKTIGDSYMCAGGIPTPNDQHALNIVKAGIEIQQYVLKYNAERLANGLTPWDARIGIHVGPVVAGVVGLKKYAYDIWGSTVNIASRMESNGEPGRVNISSATYELIKDHYTCRYRGKISAKNIGEIDMYFIENEISATQEKIPVETVVREESKPVLYDQDT